MIPLFASIALIPGHIVPADYSKTWDQVSTAISNFYYARRTKHVQMERLLTKYKPTASAADSRQAFEDSVNAMIDEFHDSHFQFFSQNDQGYYLMDALASGSSAKMPEFGAWFVKTRQGYEVKMVLEGTPADKAGLRKGDLILKVDGAPFTPVSSLKNDIGKTVNLAVVRGSRTIDVMVEVQEEDPLSMFLDASNYSIKTFDDGGRKIGYFHLWTQANSKFASALSRAVYQTFAKTDAIILDLRDGFGGRPEGYADPFFRPGTHIVWNYGDNKTDQIFGYQRPLVVLINEGSRSAKEVLSFILKKSRRATLIGATTAGNVLGTTPRKIEDWAYLELPVVDVVTDGTRLEGVGVSPDIVVSPQYDDTGKDLVLQRALDFLKSKKQ